MSYGFFASYATLDNKSKYLQKVVLDLRERLRTRLGAADEAKVGFFAVFDGILTAQAWEEKLSDAVRQARVIVLFCSNTYFNSEYCAKEFDVFRRRVKGIKPEPEVIVPVIWDLCTMPKAVARFQESHLAAMPDDYRNHGLLALRRNKTTRTRYDATLDALTGVLERLLNQPALAPLDPPVPFDMLLDAFDNPDCYSVRIGALHRDGLRWQLVPALGRTAARVVETVTASQRIPWRAFTIGDDVEAKLDEAELAREPVLLLADIAALDAGAIAARRQVIDQRSPRDCVVLVGAAEGGKQLAPGDAQARLQQLFPNMTAAGQVHWFGSDKALESLLAEHIVKLRMAMIGREPGLRMVDGALAAGAGQEGIMLEAPATLQGPGATGV